MYPFLSRNGDRKMLSKVNNKKVKLTLKQYDIWRVGKCNFYWPMMNDSGFYRRLDIMKRNKLYPWPLFR